MDLDAFRWLLTPDGQALLRRASEVYDGQAGDPMKVLDVLRRDASPEHAAAAVTQVGLRRRAHAKFGEGVIVNLEGSGSNCRAQINFGSFGMKVLDLSVAKLERI